MNLTILEGPSETLMIPQKSTKRILSFSEDGLDTIMINPMDNPIKKKNNVLNSIFLTQKKRNTRKKVSFQKIRLNMHFIIFDQVI